MEPVSHKPTPPAALSQAPSEAVSSLDTALSLSDSQLIESLKQESRSHTRPHAPFLKCLSKPGILRFFLRDLGGTSREPFLFRGPCPFYRLEALQALKAVPNERHSDFLNRPDVARVAVRQVVLSNSHPEIIKFLAENLRPERIRPDGAEILFGLVTTLPENDESSLFAAKLLTGYLQRRPKDPLVYCVTDHARTRLDEALSAKLVKGELENFKLPCTLLKILAQIEDKNTADFFRTLGRGRFGFYGTAVGTVFGASFTGLLAGGLSSVFSAPPLVAAGVSLGVALSYSALSVLNYMSFGKLVRSEVVKALDGSPMSPSVSEAFLEMRGKGSKRRP